MNNDEFGKRNPNESLAEYLRRVKAHPSQDDASQATEEQERAIDKTNEFDGGAVVIGKQ